MRFFLVALVFALLQVAPSAAFAPRFAGKARATRASALSATVTQASAGRAAAALLAGVALTLGGAPTASFAANYGGFGSKYSEVIDPKNGVLSEAGFGEEAKAGLSAIKGYVSAVQSAKADLAKDANVELYARLQKALDPGAVRSSLNKFNTAFDEDTQRGTDRLIRLILQDLTELDRETQVRPGKGRAESKVALVTKRLTAAEDALTQLAAFAK